MSELIQAGQHLDADTLNAFVEQALPEHERLMCLTHLGECARCREIVFLARGSDEVEAAPVPERAWWRWGAMAWGGAAAGIACVLVAVTMLHGRRGGQDVGVDHVARVEAPAGVVLPARVSASAPPAAAPSAGAPSAALNAKAKAAAPELAKSLRYARPAAPKAVFEEPKVVVANGVLHAPLLGGAVADGAVHGQVSRLAAAPIAAAAPAPIVNAAAASAAAALPVYSRVADKASAMSETVTVDANAVAQAAPAKPVPATASFAMRAMKRAEPAIVLPSGVGVVSSAERGGRVVAVDSTGGVYFKTDGGAGWTAVRAGWTGKAVRVEAGGAGFRLVLEGGAVWVSGDGVEWKVGR